MSCPLCHSSNLKELEILPLADLASVYQSLCGHDIRDQYQQDVKMLGCNECGLIHFDPLIAGNEAFYNALQHKPWYYSDDKEEFHFGRKWITNQDDVLEIGSGKGAFAKGLNCKSYTGLDFSQKAVDMAAAQGITIRRETVQEHARSHTGKYSFACSFQVMEHVTEVREVIQAQLDCLRSGGKLLIAVPSEDSYLKKAFNLVLNLPPHHMSRWPDQSFHFIAQSFGVKLLELHHMPLAAMHYHDYAFNLLMESFRKRWNIPYRSLDRSLKAQSARIFSLVGAKLLRHGFFSTNKPVGHTVIAVFEKP